MLPFHAAAPASSSLLRGGQFDGDLTDLQQRSFWIIVDKPGSVFVEAAGRALRDLKLWRNGVDLAALSPSIVSIEPKPGHALTRARLEGSVEPGLYLATAYGGTALPWADGEAAQPFHIRALARRGGQRGRKSFARASMSVLRRPDDHHRNAILIRFGADERAGRAPFVGGLVAKEHDENQLLRISVPSGDHSPGDLALSRVHAQLS